MYRLSPALERAAQPAFRFDGVLGERLAANTQHWLLVAPESNPSLLQMFHDRERTPPRELVPWAGEFAGKYLISAVLALRATGDTALRAYLERFVARLIASQDSDGYFGPFPAVQRMVGAGLWDLWGQYHVMLGLLRWHEATGDTAALAACRRCADYFCTFFLEGDHRVVDAGSEEMNESASHVFALLTAHTGEPRYRALLDAIVTDWETPPSGDYLRQGLAAIPFWQTPKPRWESLHAVQAIAELYFLTGEPRYRTAYENLWWSIVEGDRHNTGGFSAGEQATGNPYDPRAIETCCTIAWMCVTLDYLRLSGDSRAADELELSFWNGVLGAMSPSGRWWTYNTPMDGDKKASAHEIVFQARAGSPELNCCSVNGPRGLGMLSEWWAMVAPDGIALSGYGPGTVTLALATGKRVTLAQETRYPLESTVRLTVTPEAPVAFTLALRIPGWSERTGVRLNGEVLPAPPAGTFLTLHRRWAPGDTVTLELDFRLWHWTGEREATGKVSLYRGPLLLAYDPRFDRHDPTALPTVVPGEALLVTDDTPGDPALLRVRVPTADGAGLTLCDFASAGLGGNLYRSWLPAAGFAPTAFGRDNPLRCGR